MPSRTKDRGEQQDARKSPDACGVNGESMLGDCVILGVRGSKTEQATIKMLIMLEDDLDRIARFKAVLSSRQISYEHARTAHGFIRLYQAQVQAPILIGLDHDLFADNDDDPDPGDGRDVASFLATQVPLAPILIHSTNADAADSMLYTLTDAGWRVDRIAPIGHDWIEAYWLPTAIEMISRSR